MAHFINRTADNIFFNSPVVYQVTAGSRPRNAAFHRVILDVSISGPNGIVETPLSQPVPSDGATVEFDISSCLVASHESYVYAPVSGLQDFPRYVVVVSAHDEWVVDGESVTGVDQDVLSSQTFVAGGYSDYERISVATLSQTHSRKPSSGELIHQDDTVVYSVSTGASPRSMVAIPPVAPNPPRPAMTTLTISGRALFIISPVRNSRQFQFVNSRGVIESIRAFGIETESMKSSHTEAVRSVFERLHSISRTYMSKQLKPSVLHMSSGFVNYEWARWWAYEFCQARQCWMKHDGRWIPVHIMLSESTTLIDRTKTELLHVDFDVQPDLNGALW